MTIQDIRWEGVYQQTWGHVKPLYPQDIKSWEDQAKWCVPGIQPGELTAAMLHFVNLPLEGKEPVPPRPKLVFDWILRQRTYKTESRAAANNVPFSQREKQAFDLAEKKDWVGLSNFVNALPLEISGSLIARVKDNFSDYRDEWPDETCRAYERIHGKRCLYWRSDAPAEPLARPDPEVQGPLSVGKMFEGPTLCKSSAAPKPPPVKVWNDAFEPDEFAPNPATADKSLGDPL